MAVCGFFISTGLLALLSWENLYNEAHFPHVWKWELKYTNGYCEEEMVKWT